jgi:Mg-chelatase subunit ChlD
MSPDEPALNLENLSSWDVATRYHEFKSRRTAEGIAKQLRRLSADAILERAQEVLGSVVHPIEQQCAPLREVPYFAEQVDIDIDETLENSPLAVSDALQEGESHYPLTEQDIWMTFNVHRKQPIILTVDTSLSMTGEKLALTAVALAVVLLEFPDDPIGIIAFENEAKVLKSPLETLSVPALVERFLDVPAQGYTHLEEGMKAALRLARVAETGGHGRPPSTVLLTDGKYTAGRDPAYLAPRFSHLVVMKMGRERASLELCRELAKKGRGALREVDELEALPTVMYGVVKDLLRGRSLNS